MANYLHKEAHNSRIGCGQSLAVSVMFKLVILQAAILHTHSDNSFITNVETEAQPLSHGPNVQAKDYPGLLADNNHIHHRLQRSPRPDPSAPMVASCNICNSLCNCSKENEIFLNVVCDFTQNTKYVLDEQSTVPTEARTFHINLGAHAQLYIRGKVFRRLNRISIDGGRAGGRQQVDFGPRAFHDNTAPFPEIDLKHAQTLTIHGNAFQGDFKLNVANVANVIVQGHAFQNTSFLGHFSWVDNLRFERDAFLGTRDSQLQIEDTNVGLLERMDASMHEIRLQNCRIDAIRENTFDVVSIKSIVFENCDINVIESNFTTGKLLSEYLGIIGCRIGTIKSNAIANSGFSVLQIERNTIQSIESDAISAIAINCTVANNIIPKSGPRWFKVREWSAVRMSNNSFGHFDSIDVLGSGETCRFSRNSITQWTEGSLSSMASACRFEENVFSDSCTCNVEWLEKLSGSDRLKETSYCQIDNALRHCFNASTFNVQKYNNLVCGKSAEIDCKKSMSEKKVEANFLDPNDFASNAKQYEKYLFIAGAACLILLLVLLIIVIRLRCRQKPTSARNNGGRDGQAGINHHPTLPSHTLNKGVKSFSDNDRMIVELALEKLREKYPCEVYEQVNTYTKKLLQERLSETEKVLTIGEIVRLLDECENIGEDFLAFTDILYRHLDENQDTVGVAGNVRGAGAGDPLYAVPGVMGEEPMTTIIPSNSDNHIYAEPNSAQQPLLKTEYASPLDNSVEANVYAEPIETQHDKSTRLVSPYAIGNQLPVSSSPSTNLPDVLSRSVGGVASPVPPALPAPKLNTFGKSPQGPMPGTSRAPIPTYSIPQKNSAGTSGHQRKPLQRDNSSSSNSNHSGGSDITFKIDDIIDYADS